MLHFDQVNASVCIHVDAFFVFHVLTLSWCSFGCLTNSCFHSPIFEFVIECTKLVEVRCVRVFFNQSVVEGKCFTRHWGVYHICIFNRKLNNFHNIRKLLLSFVSGCRIKRQTIWQSYFPGWWPVTISIDTHISIVFWVNTIFWDELLTMFDCVHSQNFDFWLPLPFSRI